MFYFISDTGILAANTTSHRDSLKAITVPYHETDDFQFGDFSEFAILEHLTVVPFSSTRHPPLNPITQDQFRRVLAPKLKKCTWYICRTYWNEQLQWLEGLAQAAMALKKPLNEICVINSWTARDKRLKLSKRMDKLNHGFQRHGIKFTYLHISTR